MTFPAKSLSCLLLSLAMLGTPIPAAAQTAAPATPPPAAAPAPARAQLAVTPPGGPSEQSVRIESNGLPANAQGVLLGGQDPAALQEVATFSADPSGTLKMMAEIPGGSQYDRDYHFVLPSTGSLPRRASTASEAAQRRRTDHGTALLLPGAGASALRSGRAQVVGSGASGSFG